MGELFDLEYDLLLYDVTSTFFEGRTNFDLAQRGDSRDQRSDCKQVGHRRDIVGTPKSRLKKFEQQLLGGDEHTIREGLEVKLCAAR